MEHPELLTREQSIRNATEPFSRSPNAWLLLMRRCILSYKQSYYLQFKSWFSGKLSQRSRTEPSRPSLPVSLNKKTKGRMLMLESRVENWKRPSGIYPSVWIVLGDLSNDSYTFLVGLLELEMMKVKALNKLCTMIHGKKKRHWKHP